MVSYKIQNCWCNWDEVPNCRCTLMAIDEWSITPIANTPEGHELNVARSKLAYLAAEMTTKPGQLLLPTREEYAGLMAMVRDGER